MNQGIQFMTLTRQVKEYKEEFMHAIENVVEDTEFAGGKYVKKFEREFTEYIGADYCCGLNSGTSSIFMAMKAIGVKADDEVIVPANTFIASAWGASYCGAKPVFVDILPDTWEIDPQKIEEHITGKTKAIIGVHLYGNPFDIDAVKSIADRYGLYLIEDCAQAHGAKYKGKKVGTFGDIGCFSFYPGKNLGAFGDAGAIITNDGNFYRIIDIMKEHGARVRYHHDMEGYNLRMDGINGAVLSVKLKYLDKWNAKRKKIANAYIEGIDNTRIQMQRVDAYADPVWHLFEIQVENVQDFMKYMQTKGINCGRHYPIPCHLQKVFSHYGYKMGDIPISEFHAEHCVSLPIFPEMESEEIDCVIDACNKYRGV